MRGRAEIGDVCQSDANDPEQTYAPIQDCDAHHGETEPLAYSGDRELRDMPSWCGLLNQTEVSSAMASGSIKVVSVAVLAIAASIGTGQILFAQILDRALKQHPAPPPLAAT